jgi:hypothetical protein
MRESSAIRTLPGITEERARMSSNRSIVLLAAAAVVLGIASPVIVSPQSEMSSVLFAWFYWLPGEVANWLWPESDMAFVALTMAVHAVQYFALFTLLAVVVPLARDFLKPHKHRGRLVGRRA